VTRSPRVTGPQRRPEPRKTRGTPLAKNLVWCRPWTARIICRKRRYRPIDNGQKLQEVSQQFRNRPATRGTGRESKIRTADPRLNRTSARDPAGRRGGGFCGGRTRQDFRPVRFRSRRQLAQGKSNVLAGASATPTVREALFARVCKVVALRTKETDVTLVTIASFMHYVVLF
jgi:hypothetical protein